MMLVMCHAVFVLFHTVTGEIPSLQAAYCRSQSVVYALATNRDDMPESNQTNGTEFAVSASVRGPFEKGQLLYIISSNFYDVGSEYLLFLRSPKENELTAHTQRQKSYAPAPATPVLVSLIAGKIPVERDSIRIDTNYLVPGEDLVRGEAVLALRDEKKPFILSKGAVAKALRGYAKTCDRPKL